MSVKKELIDAQPKLRAFARSRAASPTDADDLVSHANLRVLNKEEELEQRGVKILPYAITIIRNRVIDDHRAHKRHKTDAGFDENKGISDPDVNQMGWSAQGSSYTDAESLANINDIFRLIHQLPEFCREVLVMLGAEQTYEEISESLGIKRSTIGTRALRCRKQLKELMDGAAA